MRGFSCGCWVKLHRIKLKLRGRKDIAPCEAIQAFQLGISALRQGQVAMCPLVHIDRYPGGTKRGSA
jgi:hypothetical protein